MFGKHPHRRPGLHLVPDYGSPGDRKAGWYPDPAHALGLRYWDGSRWTLQVVGAATRAS
jgi:hypothetical protein